MLFRLVGLADAQIDKILLESEAKWGLEGAGRYGKLILAAMQAVADDPAQISSRPVPRVTGVRVYHLRSARDIVAIEDRVREPRHFVLYRLASDGVVEILGLVHDRQLLSRAARHAQRDTGG